jgi:endonuclease/exonuclease/phosphatase family metal-dependent hydrolase
MKNYFLILITVFFIREGMSQNVSLITYNIRLDVASDGENAWPERKEFLVSQLQFYNPDIFGIQEGMPHQVNFIKEHLPWYSFIGEGRDGGEKGEYSAIFYNHKNYKLLKQGTFWLSTSPNIIGKGWDAAFPRICTYGLFQNKKEGVNFWVFNTHLDHLGEVSRVESAKLVLAKIKDLNSENLAVIFMGDLNAEPTSETINILKSELKDCKEISEIQLIGPEGTFNSFNYNKIPSKRIDYIFVANNKSVKVKKYGVLNNSNHLKFPSDHFPVFVKLKLKY